MQENKQKENVYFSGGRVEIEVYNTDGTLGTSFNIGCIELTLSREITKAQAFTREYGSKQKIAEVVTDENYTLKMKCNDFSAQNLALALGTNVENVTIAKGEQLPYGGTASEETKLSVLKAGSIGIIQARITFKGKPVMGKVAVAVIHQANISMNGDLSLMNDGEFGNLELEGSANASSEGYYTHYIIEPKVEAPLVEKTTKVAPKAAVVSE